MAPVRLLRPKIVSTALFTSFTALILAQTACAHSPVTERSGLFHGDSLQPTTLDQLAASIVPGTVLVIGENHGVPAHRDQQIAILRALRAHGRVVSVGLEFFPWPFQAEVEAWRAGTLPEATMLERVGWGDPSFDFYRAQASFPLAREGGATLAINAPRTVTGKIAKQGLASLNADERALLPADFTVGRESYRRRFSALMPHDPASPRFENYFVAHSAWDDTMAWRSALFMAEHPGQVLVIVVGDFHVAYGGGLPDRLRARGLGRVQTVSQVDLSEIPPDQRGAAVSPSSQDGPRADFIWLQGPDSSTSP